MAISESLSAELAQEAKATRKMLERVPAASMDWQPHAKSMTLRKLTGHLTDINAWVKDIVTKDRLAIEMGNYKAFSPGSVAELLAKFDGNLVGATAVLKGVPDAIFMRPWTFAVDGHEVFTLPKIVAIRTMVLSHAYHHRGQLSVFLRLLNVPLPSVYGPTADEQ
ncbi:MAG TPA: DinB family protein [Planctomycetota bacterium]|jgi:uncharacterized damage-inducible protein DinB